MINIEVDYEELKRIYIDKVEEHLKEIESNHYFMNTKQLCDYLNMSWPSIEKKFLYEYEFGAIRLGSKWLFNRKQVDKYMDSYYEKVRANGGDILKYKSK